MDYAACTDAVQQASDPKMASIGASGGQVWMWMSSFEGNLERVSVPP